MQDWTLTRKKKLLLTNLHNELLFLYFLIVPNIYLI